MTCVSCVKILLKQERYGSSKTSKLDFLNSLWTLLSHYLSHGCLNLPKSLILGIISTITIMAEKIQRYD